MCPVYAGYTYAYWKGVCTYVNAVSAMHARYMYVLLYKRSTYGVHHPYIFSA